MKKEYKLDDFSEVRIGTEKIEESGYWENEWKTYNVNLSSIATKLIQEAGRWCESYASDVFISWRIILEAIESGKIETSSHLFGFRENGVDHAEFVLSRYNNSSNYIASYEYRAIYRLDIRITEISHYGKKIELSLYRISNPY